MNTGGSFLKYKRNLILQVINQIYNKVFYIDEIEAILSSVFIYIYTKKFIVSYTVLICGRRRRSLFL